MNTTTSSKVSDISKLVQSWQARLKGRMYGQGLEWKRLDAELTVIEISVERLKKSFDACHPEPAGCDALKQSAVLEEIEKLLINSREMLDRGEVETAWRFYKAARCTELYLVGQDVVEERARTARQEAAKKLRNTWRGERIETLLKDPEKSAIEDVISAIKLLNEYHDNRYQKIAIIRERLNLLMVAAVLAVVGWLVLQPQFILEAPHAGPGSSTLIIWLTILLFGFVGAVFSGFVSTNHESSEREIPVQLLGSILIKSRLALGVLSALAVSIFLATGIVSLAGQKVSLEIILAAAFLAGFSERYVVDAVNSALSPR